MKARIGIVLLSLVILTVIAFSILNRGKGGDPGSPTAGGTVTLKGFVGGEKINFLQDPDVIKILQEKYGITVDAEKRGSFEMVTEDSSGKDFLWPSNEIALNAYKQKNPAASSETIFNSPIVIYSWDKVTDALIRA